MCWAANLESQLDLLIARSLKEAVLAVAGVKLGSVPHAATAGQLGTPHIVVGTAAWVACTS